MKPTTFLTLTLLLTKVIYAQPDTLWTRTFGGSSDDWGHSVQQTAEGGYVIAGCTYSFGAGESDVWLLRTDAAGDTLWTRTFGGSDYDYGDAVQQTAEGGYILTGETLSFAAGVSAVYLIKTDPAGDTTWTRTFDGSSGDWGHSVQQTAEGGYVIAGCTYSFGAGESDVWLLRTDAAGDTLWTRTFGGPSWDGGSSVQQTADGGYIITGITYSFGAGESDVWLLRTDAAGDTLWTRTYGGAGGDMAFSVQQTTDGGYVITGCTESFGADSADVWLIKTNASGVEQWSRSFGGSDYDLGASVQQTTDGGYIIAGWTESFGAGQRDAWLIKTDASGDTLWTFTLGGGSNDGAHAVWETTDGGYVVAGRTRSYGAGYYDVWLIRLGPEAPIATIPIEASLPTTYALHPAYPNPFNPATTICYDLPEAADVTIVVYDLAGREIARLVEGHVKAGYHQVVWQGRTADGREVPTGIYIARLLVSPTAGVTTEYTKTIKMIMMK